MVKARDKNGKEVSPDLRRNFHNFLNSLSDALIDITALEVNTMVVEEITANKFIPWEAYRDIYLISERHLERKQIYSSLQPRYLDLRKKLEMEYCAYLLENETSQKEVSDLMNYYESLSDPAVIVDADHTRLPNPLNPTSNPAAEIAKVQNLLENGRFLRCLRKLIELKVALDNQNTALKKLAATNSENLEAKAVTDVIYAQTIIQMDGDIINRYNQRIFNHEHKDIILDIHRQGAIAGEKQWHGLVEFMVSLVELLMGQRNPRKDSLNKN